MKYTWDLKNLYSKKEDFYYDMTLVRDKIKKICEHREIKVNGDNLYNLMNECFSIREINSKTLLYASLNYYLDINNSDYINMKKQAEELDIFVLNETSFIDELLCVLEEDKLCLFYNECPSLNKYRFYIDNVRRMGKHLVNNDNIDSYNISINNNLINYNKLINNMDFGKVDGVSLNTSNLGMFLINEDRNIRKDTFNSVNNIYISLKEKYFNIFNEIISCRKKIALEKNYSSILESELYKDDIDFKYVDNLIKLVNKNIGLMNKYLELKCSYLKIDFPHLYDINIPICNCSNEFDIDSSIDIIKSAFSIFGDKYIDCINYLINNNHLDLECNNKKHPSIVFSWNTYSFINYKDRYIDIKNLAHELGHIVNSYLSIEKQPFIYSDSTVFTGEVSSIVNEIILNDYLYKNSKDKEDKVFYLTKIIENFISQVYRQIMYTEFENIIYDKDTLDIDFVCDSYLSLINKYYGKVLNIDKNICSEWMRNGHLFRYSYYVYKYASGYVLAFNIVDSIKKDNSKYIDFLSSGCCCSNEELLKKLDIDIYSIDLLENSFDLLDKYIKDLEYIIKK